MSSEDGKHRFTLSPICAACFNFTTDGKMAERKTIVVVPNTLQLVKQRTVIGWACSRGRSCLDRDCHYSTGSRENEHEDNESYRPFADVGDR